MPYLQEPLLQPTGELFVQRDANLPVVRRTRAPKHVADTLTLARVCNILRNALRCGRDRREGAPGREGIASKAERLCVEQRHEHVVQRLPAQEGREFGQGSFLRERPVDDVGRPQRLQERRVMQRRGGDDRVVSSEVSELDG